MSKPCNCGQAKKGVPYESPACRLCWLALNDERYAKLWSETTSVIKVTRNPLCSFRGDELTIAEIFDRKLTPLPQWVFCLHPEKPLGEAVCGCLKPIGCGSRCPGYKAIEPQENT